MLSKMVSTIYTLQTPPTRLLTTTRLVKKSSLDEDGSDSVWVDVGGGSSVLEVTVTLSTDMSRNSDRSTSVGDTGREAGH